MSLEHIENYKEKVADKYKDLSSYMSWTLDELKQKDDELRVEYDKLSKKIKSKVFKVKSTKKHLENLIDFFKNDIKWVGRQAFGVIAIYKLLNKELAKYKGNTTGFNLKVHEMEGIMHFFAKCDGYGVEEAEIFVDKVGDTIMKSISSRLDDAKKILDKMQDIEIEINAMKPYFISKMEGIDLEAEIKEITNNNK